MTVILTQTENLIVMLMDKACIHITSDEGVTAGKVVQKAYVGGDATNCVVTQSLSQSFKCAISVAVPDHQFGDHGVIIDAHLVAFEYSCIHSHMAVFFRWR